MPQKVANILIFLFTLPQSVAIVIKSHKMWHIGVNMKDKQNKPTDVRFRLEKSLHEPLKELAKKEERSMNYLMNKAVELLLTKESAKA